MERQATKREYKNSTVNIYVKPEGMIPPFANLALSGGH